jgi:hypothetical protein
MAVQKKTSGVHEVVENIKKESIAGKETSEFDSNSN